MIKQKGRIWTLMLTGLLMGTTAVDASGNTVTAPAGTHLMVQMTQTINSRQHMAQLRTWGVDAALIGEALVTSGDPAGKLRELLDQD